MLGDWCDCGDRLVGTCDQATIHDAAKPTLHDVDDDASKGKKSPQINEIHYVHLLPPLGTEWLAATGGVTLVWQLTYTRVSLYIYKRRLGY